MPTKQHGQIRGYQVHYVRMVNGEPTGQPAIKDILIDDAQVRHHLRQMLPFFSLSCKSLIWTFTRLPRVGQSIIAHQRLFLVLSFLSFLSLHVLIQSVGI